MCTQQLSPIKDARLLVVEDDFIVAESLQYLLDSCGVRRVALAPSVEAALARIDAEPFDAAVLDIHLKHRDALPVAWALRERAVPFIFVTGYGDAFAMPEELRAVPRLPKPIDLNDLATALGRVMPINPPPEQGDDDRNP